MSKNNIPEKQKMSSQNKASIAGGKLILSLPDAESPVVWQMSLDNAQASAFVISEDKKKKIFSLVSKDQDGKEISIADFKQKDDAVAVLMQASEVLQSGVSAVDGMINQNVAAAPKDKSDRYGALIAFALIVVVFAVWMISASSNIQDVTGSNSMVQSDLNVAPRDSSGVPVSADDFLSNQ